MMILIGRASQRQRGAVLFLAMIFLVLLAVLAVTASSTSIMQERMTGGMRNRQLGLMGAETALRGGEEYLWNLNYDCIQPLTVCADEGQLDCLNIPTPNGLLTPRVQAFRTSKEWLDPGTDTARPYERQLTGLGGSGQTASLATQPRYLLEMLGAVGPPSKGKTGGIVYKQKGPSNPGEQFYYRITARSQGGTDAVVRVAESYYTALNFSTTGFNPNSCTPTP